MTLLDVCHAVATPVEVARRSLSSPAMVPVHEQIAAALERQGRSVTWLGKAIGWRSRPVAYRLLSGEHEPSDETIQAAANALGEPLTRPAKTFVPAVPRRSGEPPELWAIAEEEAAVEAVLGAVAMLPPETRRTVLLRAVARLR